MQTLLLLEATTPRSKFKGLCKLSLASHRTEASKFTVIPHRRDLFLLGDKASTALESCSLTFMLKIIARIFQVNQTLGDRLCLCKMRTFTRKTWVTKGHFSTQTAELNSPRE